MVKTVITACTHRCLRCNPCSGPVRLPCTHPSSHHGHTSSSYCFCSAETKKLLYGLFGQFGKILDVVCLKTPRLRGQAWVVFADITSATNALRAMQGFPFFDKPIVSEVEYSEGF